MPTPHAEALPATPASDGGPAARLRRQWLRERLVIHVARAALVASIVTVVAAVVSVYLAVAGVVQCHADAEDTVCRERHFYPFTAQTRSDVTTRNGVLDGMRREWHRNGQPWLEGRYQDGARVGRWREWHQSGARRFDGTYQDDRLEGTEAWWYDNGQMEWVVVRHAGLRVGQERWWHPNGKLRRVGTYNEAGEKDGRFVVYDEDGHERFAGSYENGVPDGDATAHEGAAG